MLRATLFSLIATVLPTLAAQVPLGSGHHWQAEHYPAILRDDDIAEWSLDKLPNPDATDHLVFETVHSLLQHWPNTRMRNGHNIVPGSIPKGTLLYHGTSRKELPPGPDWVATDPEHSYLFCQDWFNHSQEGCWHLTFAATRPLKVIYFDGNSAAKLPYGTLDTQDLIAWSKISDGSQSGERKRIQDLCKWGRNFGVDGFVRMEMDFEIMLCDFTSGVRVAFANLVSRRAISPMKPAFVSFEVLNAGSWHNRFPGETRVQLDLAGLVSFYDTQLAPSLTAIRAGQERWDHRVGNISKEDLSAIKSRLEAVLIRPRGLSSGIDWTTLVQVIVDRYSERLELTRYLLNSSTTGPDEIVDLANKTQAQLRIMLTPYLLFSATPIDESDKTELDWTVPIYKLCATTHTYSMESELDSMTDAEKLLLKAVRGTSREICRVVTKMWAAGVYAGIDPLLNTKESLDVSEITHLFITWAEDLNSLVAWLDWSVWVKCNPGCGPEEMCYLPTWPVGFPRMEWSPGRKPPSPPHPDRSHSERPHPKRLTSFDFRTMAMESLAEELSNIIKPESDEWIRPQPKCVRRVYADGS
ncbi:hypothetical protein J3R82DRAFT_11859 [Butyriboletus roseoflavus]|nr:hypothetical protein J3R82DRAFT_11859 [Butyriboletus roseoflavus]